METNPFNHADFYRDYKFACDEIVAAHSHLLAGNHPDEETIRKLFRLSSGYFWLEWNEDLTDERTLPPDLRLRSISKLLTSYEPDIFSQPYAAVAQRAMAFIDDWFGPHLEKVPQVIDILINIVTDPQENIRTRSLSAYAITHATLVYPDPDPETQRVRDKVAAAYLAIARNQAERPDWRASFILKLHSWLLAKIIPFSEDYAAVANQIKTVAMDSYSLSSVDTMLNYARTVDSTYKNLLKKMQPKND